MFLEEFKEGHYPERDFEHDNVIGKNEDDTILVNNPLRVLTATSLIGDKIENPQGEHLGKIKDIMFDLSVGCIDYLVIEFGGFLGFGEKLFAVPFQAFSVDADRKILILERSKESLKKAPGFDKQRWPETNSHHFDEINYFWGYLGPYGLDNESNKEL